VFQVGRKHCNGGSGRVVPAKELIEGKHMDVRDNQKWLGASHVKLPCFKAPSKKARIVLSRSGIYNEAKEEVIEDEI